jgi:Glycosyltransferase
MPFNGQAETAGLSGGPTVVLHVVPGISAEGIGTFVLNMLEHLDRSKTKVLLAVTTDWEQLHESRARELGAEIWRTAEIGAGPAGWARHFVRLIRLIRRHGAIDAVHSHMDYFNGINCLAALLARVPVRISHAHRAAESGKTGWPRRLYSLVMRLLIAACATERVGCSDSANEGQHRIGPWRFGSKVVRNGIDMSIFSPDRTCGKPDGIDLREGEVRFVAVGRMDEVKNPLFLVRVFHEVRKRVPDVRLYWIGHGSLRGEVEALIAKLGLESSVALLGVRRDVADILPWMDYMLLPSRREGLGIALIEAQACGVKCFVSDTVPAEADLGLCVFLPLGQHEVYWAERICERLKAGGGGLALDSERAARYDIRQTVRELETLWRARRGKAGRGVAEGGVRA